MKQEERVSWGEGGLDGVEEGSEGGQRVIGRRDVPQDGCLGAFLINVGVKS